MALNDQAMKFGVKPAAICGICLLVALSGCGRRGQLESPAAPPAAEDPAASASTFGPGPAASADLAEETENEAPLSRFPLDFLI